MANKNKEGFIKRDITISRLEEISNEKLFPLLEILAKELKNEQRRRKENEN